MSAGSSRAGWMGWRATLLALLAGLGLARPLAAAEPASQPAGLSGSVPAGVLRATLGNGLRVVVVPDPLAPVVATAMNYLVGSNDAPEGFPGTAHALEHMMFRGSEGLDRDQLAELGAQLGGAYNASTTETLTQYTYTLPAADLELSLRSEALRMRGLTLSEADWEHERGAIEQEVSRDLSSPFYAYASQVQGLLFAGTPYAQDALGTRASFDKTDTALLRQFYDRWYAPNNAILVIAGDVDPAQVLAMAGRVFGGIERRDVPPHAGFTLAPVQPRTITLPTNFPYGLVTLAFRMPGLRGADFAAADILGDVLGSQRAALYGLVPSGRALLAQFSYQAKADVGFGMALAAFPAGEDPSALLADVRGVLADVVAQGVPPELVEASKRQELAQLAFENDSISGLARTWSRALASKGLDSPDEVAKEYAAVTVADVDRLARTLLDPAHSLVGILTPQNADAPVTSGGFAGTETFNTTPDHPVTLPGWAAAALAQLPRPETVTLPVASVLPNGLRLLVQPEHVSRTVSVYGEVRGEAAMQQPPGKDGVATLMDRLLDDGTALHDRLAFRKAVDDIGAVVDGGTHFSLKALTPQFEAGMRLLAEQQLQPAFPAEGFAVARRQLAQSVAGRLRSPSYLYTRAIISGLMPQGDPLLRQATPQTVSALQLADVRAYYAATMRPDLTTIIVLGDVTVAEARRVVAETFGGWEAQGAIPAIDLPPVGLNPPQRARVPDPSSQQDQVSLNAIVDLPVTSFERYKLELGNLILGSGFSSRLLQDLRVKTGYVYSASSSFHWDRTRAFHTVSFGADAANVARARALALRDLRQMQDTPVSEMELARAKAQVLRQLPMQRASVAAIAAQYLRLARLGLPLDSEAIAAGQYRQITAADIQQAFAKWLHPDALAEVVEGPPLPQ